MNSYDDDNKAFDDLAAAVAAENAATEEAERSKIAAEAVTSEKPIKWIREPLIKPGAAIKRARQVAFLKEFARCGVVSRACKNIGINNTTERQWRNNSADIWYAAQFKDALQAYRDLIEQEVHNRAIVGEQVPIIGKRPTAFGMEDQIIGYKTVKSDLLLMFHGKRHIPEYRDKYEAPKEDIKPVDTGSPMARITVRLDMMSRRQQVEVPTTVQIDIGNEPEQRQIESTNDVIDVASSEVTDISATEVPEGTTNGE